MPKYPGSQTQLGGEFVFEHDRSEFLLLVTRGDLFPVADALSCAGLTETDSFKCLFVSRMHNTRAHAEVSLRWQEYPRACKPRSDHPLLARADHRSAMSLRQPVSNSTSRTPPASMAHDETLAGHDPPGLTDRISISLFR